MAHIGQHQRLDRRFPDDPLQPSFEHQLLGDLGRDVHGGRQAVYGSSLFNKPGIGLNRL